MATFVPPTTDGLPTSIAGMDDADNRHWRYFETWAMGKTVWKDQLGAWHAQIYPYQGGDKHTVHDTVENTTTVTTDTSVMSLANAQVVYHGGHVYPISEAAADELVAAGFGANITTRESIAENFNKADGALGPQLTWTREVFTSPYQFRVVSNEAQFSANTVGSWEDIGAPYPNVDGPDATVTMSVTALTRGLGLGAPDYVIDVGPIMRYQIHSGGTDYRGYAAGIGRNNIFFPPGHTWHLLIFRVDKRTEVTLIASSLLAFGSVTLPGTLTITSDGPNHSASFSHAGSGGTMSVNAVDSTYLDGAVRLGASVVLEDAADSGAITVDNFAVGPA